jgi:hypothetical protein
MIPRRRSPSLLLATALAATAPAAPQSQEDEMDAHGYDKVRIEQEDKLLVPLELREEVWAYLKQRLVDDAEFVKSLDPAFSASWSEELFHDTYYDTPSMQLYALKSGVRHRTRENLTDPDDVKSGRELMQIKLNDVSENELERAEIKYDIEHPREKNSALDAHPMLGIVKPSHRGPFEKRLTELGLDARSMKPILTVRDLRRRVYWKKEGNPFMSISFDQADARVWWSKAEFCEIEPELNEIGFTEADEETRTYMETVLARVVADIRGRFPAITRDLNPKYNKAFDRIEQGGLPFFRTLVRFGLQSRQGMYVFLCGAALLAFVVYQVIAKRLRSPQLRRRVSSRTA